MVLPISIEKGRNYAVPERLKIRRKAPHSKKEDIVMGIAWYQRDQWPRLLEISADRDQIENSYDEWLANASKTFEQLKSEGLSPAKMNVDTAELLAWRRSRNRPFDAKERAEYVVERIQKIRQGEHL
ncbi:MAG: hypothetical protein ACRD19_15325 [Terriglobia bacterium]